MGIREDSGEILYYAYDRYVSSGNFGGLSESELSSETKWSPDRIRRAVNYLKQKQMIKAIFYIGGGFWIQELTPDGIDIVEHEDEFKTNFGLGINLGVLSLSWGKQQK